MSYIILSSVKVFDIHESISFQLIDFFIFI